MLFILMLIVVITLQHAQQAEPPSAYWWAFISVDKDAVNRQMDTPQMIVWGRRSFTQRKQLEASYVVWAAGRDLHSISGWQRFTQRRQLWVLWRDMTGFLLCGTTPTAHPQQVGLSSQHSVAHPHAAYGTTPPTESSTPTASGARDIYCMCLA